MKTSPRSRSRSSGIHVGAAPASCRSGYAPAWSPNARAHRVRHPRRPLGRRRRRHAPRAARRRTPTSRRGRRTGERLAFTRDGVVWTVRADGLDERRLATRRAPGVVSRRQPASRSTATARSTRCAGTAAALKHAGAGTDPAYAPGRPARRRAGRTRSSSARERSSAPGPSPTWSPTGGRSPTGATATIYVDGRPVATRAQPAWRPARPRRGSCCPDFDQRAPTGLIIAGGAGPLAARLHIAGRQHRPRAVGARRRAQPRPAADDGHAARAARERQGGAPTRDVAQFRYTNSPPHHHWHLMQFDIFSCARSPAQTLVRDRKSGFCLADHWGAAPGTWPGRQPRVPRRLRAVPPGGDARRRWARRPATPTATRRSSTARTSTSRDVPAGIYDLVHRVNANMLPARAALRQRRRVGAHPADVASGRAARARPAHAASRSATC